MQLFLEKTCRPAVAIAAAWLVLLSLLSFAVPASAQQYGTPGMPPFNERYPADAIHSTDDADEILTEAGKERAVISDQYLDDQRACYKKFFVSHCLEEAKERNRIAGKQVRDVEVEANAYKRQTKADDRDKALSEQRLKDEQEFAHREQEQKEKAAASAKKVQESAAKQQQVNEREQQNEGRADYRVKEHDAKVRSEEAAEAAKAPERAANEKAYQEKVKAAEAHRKEVEAKQAEKAKERAAKQQQQQSPSPAAAPAPSK